MQERYYFIVNPISGSGRGKREFEQARALLEAAGACYAFVSTQYHAHAKELARAALAAGERCIVAVGGDGTVNEVASVLAGTGRRWASFRSARATISPKRSRSRRILRARLRRCFPLRPGAWMPHGRTMRFL